jgi:hypothetical protein
MLSPNRQKLRVVVGSTQTRRLAHDQEETEIVRERHADVSCKVSHVRMEKCAAQLGPILPTLEITLYFRFN